MSRGLAAIVEGSGPAVLLIHGQPGSAVDWSGVRGRLRTRYRTLTPDRPGYGNTGGRAVGLVANAEAMGELLDDLDVADAVVAGHSWGAGVALALAQHHPDKVRRLVLVCPVTPNDRIGWVDRVLATRRLGLHVARAGFWLAGLALSTRRVQSRITELLPGFEAERSPEIALALRRGSLSRSFHEEQRALLDELPQLRDGLPRLAAPTTVVVGTHDRVTSPADGRAFAAAVGARLVELDGGHLLPLQKPDAVAEAIEGA